MLFSRNLHHDGHTRRFVIRRAAGAGWDVRAEEDARILADARYRDWRRVERARLVFESTTLALEQQGWTVEGRAIAPEA
jgi:hypothetical protein